MAACNSRPNAAAARHLAHVKGLCEGKQRCNISPTSATFGVNCDGFRRLWITYSCQIGVDLTTVNTKRPTPPPPRCPNNNRKMVSRDIPLDGGWINIHCAGNCPIVINKAMAACNSRPNAAAARHLAHVKRLCEGKQRCNIKPTSATFGVTCFGFRRLWITYSCQVGFDQTTFNIKRPPQINCQNNRQMVSRDIHLDSGFINVHCSGTCPIVINKAMAACTSRQTAGTGHHIGIVKGLCEGKHKCSIRPTSAMFGVTCNPGGWFGFGARNPRRMWITYSCVRGHDKTTFRAKGGFGGTGFEAHIHDGLHKLKIWGK